MVGQRVHFLMQVQNMKNHSEDDTFKALLRPRVYEMHEMLKIHFVEYHAKHNTYPSTENIIFCNKHNWDWVEFLLARKAAGISY
jgi:hypothetical protein